MGDVGEQALCGVRLPAQFFFRFSRLTSLALFRYTSWKREEICATVDTRNQL